jgi:hypothetical protein
VSEHSRRQTWTLDELAKRNDDQVASIATRVTNRLCKWRSVLAGWQLGTRSSDDPESQAVRDHREATLLLRVEVNALTACLIEAGVFSGRRFTEQVIVECEYLDRQFAARFPGMRSTDDGVAYELPLAAETMRGWRP